MLLQHGKVNVIIDGQFGSTGKGLWAGYVAQHAEPGNWLAVTNAAPNAGHTYISPTGEKFVTKHLPMFGVRNGVPMYLCAGAIINPRVLQEEMDTLGVKEEQILIHPNAAVITEEDIERERHRASTTTNLASTQSGVGMALSRKTMRYPDAIAIKHPWLQKMVKPNFSVSEWLKRGRDYGAVMEVPQGIGLSLNDTPFYPYCTSRSVNVAQALSDCGVHPSLLGRVHMTLRTYPIRVGNIVEDNIQLGYSGPFYMDSEEVTWNQLGQEKELTTVTKRVRRIATFSIDQYAKSCELIKPDVIFLNFCNYMKNEELKELITKMRRIYNPGDLYLGWGPKPTDIRRI